VVVTQRHAQSVFNVLDSSSYGAVSVIEIDSSYYVSGGMFNGSGTGSVSLSHYDSSGQLNYFDTLSADGIVTTSGRLQNLGGDIYLFNLYNDTPPYNSDTRQLQLSSLNSLLPPQWSQFYGGSNQETPADFRVLAGSNYLLGTTSSFGAGNEDMYLIKTDINGSVIWEKTYGGLDVELASDLEVTSTSDLLISGGTRSLSASVEFDFYIVKTDSNGNLIWEKNFGGSYNLKFRGL